MEAPEMTRTSTAAIAKDIWPVREVMIERDPNRKDLRGKKVTLAFIALATVWRPYKG
jgi:hypothetical protein